MKSPGLVLHDAQVARIELDTAYKVYDAHPQDVAYPYIMMGEMTDTDWSAKGEPGQEVFSTIHIWSQYKGRKEAEEMYDAVLQALTRAELDLAPDFNAFGYFDGSNIITDLDGVTRHRILRFRYLIEEV